MGKPMTKQRLSQYIYLKMEVEHQEERIARMKREETIPALRIGDGSKHSPGTGDRMERAILRRMEYEEKVSEQLCSATEEMRKIEAAVDSLPDIQEREVLRLRYLDGDGCRHTSWSDVAMALYKDNDEKHRTAVIRLHGRALQSIAEIRPK